jgi:hypothetical protein
MIKINKINKIYKIKNLLILTIHKLMNRFKKKIFLIKINKKINWNKMKAKHKLKLKIRIKIKYFLLENQILVSPIPQNKFSK